MCYYNLISMLIFGICVMLLTRKALAQTRAEFIKALIVDYDSRIPPNFDQNNYTEVEVSLYINSIDSINEKTMDYTMNAFVQQEWTDTRLQFFGLIDSPYLELDSKLLKEVWVPDLYFTNEKKASFHAVTVPNRMLHLYQDGRIVYRLRVSLTASCPMNLQKYPFDSQVCSLYIQSFAYTKNSLQFKWKDVNPVMTNSMFELPQFRLDRHRVDDCAGFGEENSNFTCIRMELFLTRNLGFYMIQVYIPTILIVLLSWVSFWLSVDAVPARISLGILTVLTMTTQKTNSVAAVPPVSYVKALDIWMAACLIFVFAALLEFAFAYVNQRQEEKQNHMFGSLENNGECKDPMNKNTNSRINILDRFGKEKAKRIDNLSKIIFPAIFSVFLIAYWIAFMI